MFGDILNKKEKIKHKPMSVIQCYSGCCVSYHMASMTVQSEGDMVLVDFRKSRNLLLCVCVDINANISLISFLFRGHRSLPIQSLSSPNGHCSHQIQSVSRSDGGSAARDNLYSLSPRQPSGKAPWNQWSPCNLTLLQLEQTTGSSGQSGTASRLSLVSPKVLSPFCHRWSLDSSGLLSWGHFISSDITNLIAQILFKLN